MAFTTLTKFLKSGNYVTPDDLNTVLTALNAVNLDTTAPTFTGLTVTGTSTLGTTASKRPVYTTSTVLTSADSGAMCFWNAAAGFTYTLPTPAAGLTFDFVVLVTATSSAHKVLSPASTFLLGGFIQSTDGTYTSAYQAADGTTIRAWSGNGTTTGGLQGDWLRLVGLSATQYAVWGMGRATGTEATPFATS